MKNSFLTFAALALLSGFQTVHAQREAPDRSVRREQRQQQMQNMTPAERLQFFEQRFQERLKSATPEQRERLLAGRAQLEARMREQGIDPNNPADVQRAIQEAMGGGQGGNRQGGRNRNRGGNVAQTPAMRDQARRALMTSAGITEKAAQDAIIAFMNDEEKARQPLLQLARAAALSLDPSPKKQYDKNANGELIEIVITPTPGSDEAVAKSLETYQSALAADKTRHDAALKALDAKISYSTKPRLKAFLSLVGVIDSDALSLGGAAAIFAPAAPQNGEVQNDAPQNDAPRRARGAEQE